MANNNIDIYVWQRGIADETKYAHYAVFMDGNLVAGNPLEMQRPSKDFWIDNIGGTFEEVMNGSKSKGYKVFNGQLPPSLPKPKHFENILSVPLSEVRGLNRELRNVVNGSN